MATVQEEAAGARPDPLSPGPAESPTHDVDPVGLLAVAGAGLLPVVFVDQLFYGVWAPKAAVCLVLLGPGLVVLARLAVAGSRPARLAAAFLAAAAASTALADRPLLSLVGSANLGTGWLLLATTAGGWALGAAAGERRRRQIELAVIAATVANAAVAWGQARFTSAGRVSGLMGNPVFLGGLAAGCLYLLGRRLGRGRASLAWLPAVVVVAGAAQLSGGRAAVVLAVVAVAASLPGAGLVRALAVVAATVAGLVLGPLGAENAVLASTRSAPASVVQSDDTRFAVWSSSAGAARERALLGWGPGRFAAATGPRYTPVAAQEGVVLKDAHNWVVQHAVTTGLVGLALLLAWLGTAAVVARGPLAGFAAILGASGLVQPLNVALTPLALLALGAAARRGGPPSAPARPVRLGRVWGAAATAALGVGVSAAVVLLVGQAVLQRGVETESAGLIRRAGVLSPPWPEVASAAAGVEARRGLREGEPHRARTLALSREAATRDAADPAWWSELARVELSWGTEEAASEAIGRALAANPWDAGALLARARLALRQDDDAARADSCRRLAEVGWPVPLGLCREAGARPATPATPQS